MTVGYEFGFKRPLDVVKTRPTDWEEPRFDLAPFLRLVNGLKATHPLLRGEGVLRRLDWGGSAVTVLRRWSDETGTHRGVLVVNRDLTVEREVTVDRSELPGSAEVLRPCRDARPLAGGPVPDRLTLAPAEVVRPAVGACPAVGARPAVGASPPEGACPAYNPGPPSTTVDQEDRPRTMSSRYYQQRPSSAGRARDAKRLAQYPALNLQ